MVLMLWPRFSTMEPKSTFRWLNKWPGFLKCWAYLRPTEPLKEKLELLFWCVWCYLQPICNGAVVSGCFVDGACRWHLHLEGVVKIKAYSVVFGKELDEVYPHIWVSVENSWLGDILSVLETWWSWFSARQRGKSEWVWAQKRIYESN